MPQPTAKHQWVEDIKGPIVCLPVAALPAWKGVAPGDEWPGAVAVEGVLGIVEVGELIGLMLHDAFAGAYTAWEALASGGGVLVSDLAYRGDEACEAVAHVPASAWVRVDRVFRVAGGGAVLFDGAWPGNEFEDTGYAFSLPEGDYRVDAVPRFEHGAVVARLVRLTPVA